MSYVQIAKMGMTAVSNISASYLKDADIDASNTINEANAYASNLVRSANNKLSAARSSLAYYNQSVNNKRVLQNAGSAAEAATVNYRRTRDNAATGSVEDQIRFAEQAGAQASVAAFSGLTGGVVDVVRGATALRQSRIQQRTAEMLKQGDYDASKQSARILQAGWDSLDTSDLTANLDYSRDVAQTRRSNSSLFFDIMSGQDTKDMSNAASKAKSFFNAGAANPMDRYLIGNSGSGD
jgi:hypothetical protein